MKIYIATVKVRGASPQKIETTAPDAMTALALLKAQYGREATVSSVRVKPSEHRRP